MRGGGVGDAQRAHPKFTRQKKFTPLLHQASLASTYKTEGLARDQETAEATTPTFWVMSPINSDPSVGGR